MKYEELDKRAIVVLAEDWAGVYVDGMCIGQGHSFDEVLYGHDSLTALKIATEYNLKYEDFFFVDEEDLTDITWDSESYGGFPQQLKAFWT